MTKGRPNPACIVKVGEGRGFVIEHDADMANLRQLQKKERLPKHVSIRLVVTAAHCLPELPKPHAWGDVDRVYQNLLGTLDTRNTTVWAECVFADPVADTGPALCLNPPVQPRSHTR